MLSTKLLTKFKKLTWQIAENHFLTQHKRETCELDIETHLHEYISIQFPLDPQPPPHHGNTFIEDEQSITPRNKVNVCHQKIRIHKDPYFMKSFFSTRIKMVARNPVRRSTVTQELTIENQWISRC